jgi:hypothetical protein
VEGQKRPQIALSDAHDAINPVHNQSAVRNPAPNRARRNVESFGHCFNGEELREITTAVTTTIGNFGAHDAAPSEHNVSNEA